jgi:uncharacterized membrane protein
VRSLFVLILIALSLSVPAAAQDVSEAPTPEDGHDPVGPVVMIGAGAIVFGGGLALFLIGSSDRDAVESAPASSSWADYEERAARGPIFMGVGQVLMAAGLIVVGAGLTWLVLTLAGADRDPFGTAGLELEVGPTSVWLRGAF